MYRVIFLKDGAEIGAKSFVDEAAALAHAKGHYPIVHTQHGAATEVRVIDTDDGEIRFSFSGEPHA